MVLIKLEANKLKFDSHSMKNKRLNECPTYQKISSRRYKIGCARRGYKVEDRQRSRNNGSSHFIFAANFLHLLNLLPHL